MCLLASLRQLARVYGGVGEMIDLGRVNPDRLVYETKKAYNRESEAYIHHSANIGLKVNLKSPWAVSDLLTWRILNNLMKSVKKDGNGVVKGLDAGCGDGIWALRLANKYKSVEIIGIDISDKLVEIANWRARELGLANRCTFVVADMRNLRFISDNTIDFIISLYDPLNHIPDESKAIKEFYRLLKPGGYAFISVHSISDFGFYVVEPEEVVEFTIANLQNCNGEVLIFRTRNGLLHKVYAKRYTFEELKCKFESAGFEVLEGYGIDICAKRRLDSLLKRQQLSLKDLRREIARLYLEELKLYRDQRFINSAVHIGILVQKPK